MSRAESDRSDPEQRRGLNEAKAGGLKVFERRPRPCESSRWAGLRTGRRRWSNRQVPAPPGEFMVASPPPRAQRESRAGWYERRAARPERRRGGRGRREEEPPLRRFTRIDPSGKQGITRPKATKGRDAPKSVPGLQGFLRKLEGVYGPLRLARLGNRKPGHSEPRLAAMPPTSG